MSWLSSAFSSKKENELNQQLGALQQQQGQLQAQAIAEQQKVADIQFSQTKDTLATNKAVIGYQQQGEYLKQFALNLDASRQTRNSIREGLLARSLSTVRAVSQGAGLGDSSVIGSSAQIANATAGNVLGVRQSQISGNKLFDISRSITGEQLAAQDRNLGFLEQQFAAETNVRNLQQQSVNLSQQQSYLQTKLSETQANKQSTLNVINTATSLFGLFK